MELGDRKSTELLLSMKHLLGNMAGTLGTYILRELFLQQLPQDVSLILTAADTCSFEALARMTDTIVKVRSLESMHCSRSHRA